MKTKVIGRETAGVESALIVSSTEKSIQFLTEILQNFSVPHIKTVSSCAFARQQLLEHTFDFVLINVPLQDESGENLALHVASLETSQVILTVKLEYFDEISSAVENYGIMTIPKPVNRSLFWSALKIAKAAQIRLKSMRQENTQLVKKIEDIRIIDRAKCLLISHLSLNETEAHKFIEKQSMDRRTTKRAIAEGIVKTYDS